MGGTRDYESFCRAAVCALDKLGYAPADIAALLRISPETVRAYRISEQQRARAQTKHAVCS